MLKVKGTIQYRAIATGTWIIETETGEVYELYKPPQAILQDNLRVSIEGRIREDVMTVAMVGKILEVFSFEVCR